MRSFGPDQQSAALADLLAGEIDAALAEAAWRLIDGARRIVLLAHEHPDADALGSALGLAHALAPLGKECVVACADPAPADYTFLPGVERVVTELPDERFDLVIALDAGEMSRYGALYWRHRAFFDGATVLNIDHHASSHGCGAVSIIDVASAATAELLTLLLLARAVPIERDAAICLLAGIITDTRAFEFTSTTARTLAAGAYLVSRGAVPAQIIKPVYRYKPLAKSRLWGLVLSTIGSAAEGQLIWAELRRDMLAATGASPDMDDGLPSYLMDTTGVRIAALFREAVDGGTRVSVRTVAPYDASAIAQRYGGGGHARAAGFSRPAPLAEARDEVLAYLRLVLAAGEAAPRREPSAGG
jgi:bifunctional oligoribonuclease and PAP phosphatase NrnA